MIDYRDRDRDRDNRPSWREKDRKKDKSRHVGDDRLEKKKQNNVSTGYGRYKDQLDQLFTTGEQAGMVKSVLQKKDEKEILRKKGAPERQKLLRAIREAVSERQVEEKIDQFLEKYKELPDDVEVLTQTLLHGDDLVKEQALRKISKYLDGHVLEKKALLLERARNLVVMSEDDVVMELAKEVKKKLGA